MCQGQDKGVGGKRIRATKAQPFISRKAVSTSQLISFPCEPQGHILICHLLLHFSAPLRKDCVSKRG
uniref:Uncharacterized protein n=1 Tax=Arundo donax TaxID=35708 RepID=A0A0A9EM00_ARUDO